jgi:putative ABC transport system permease protein
LTFDDATAIGRIRGVARVMPVIVGSAPVEHVGRTRNTFVYGFTSAAPEVIRMRVRTGRFLPEMDLDRTAPVAVLGPKLKQELFGEENCLGAHVRIAGRRFLIIGVMEPKGQFLGFDIDDTAYIPVASAQQLFNRDALQEIDVLIANASLIEPVVERIRALLVERHNKEEDFTITTQTGMLDTLDRVIRIVSMAVGGIGAISLLVGSIGILTLMWISVHERTSEIGLARAVGATSSQVLVLFLTEAVVLATCGGILGVISGLGLCQLLRLYVPALPVQTPPGYVALALLISSAVGLASGLIPARKAARLDPVAALGAE